MPTARPQYVVECLLCRGLCLSLSRYPFSALDKSTGKVILKKRTNLVLFKAILPLEKALIVLRISKLTDYGIMLLTHMARGPASRTYSASVLAARAHLSLPTVSKLLKTLARTGLLSTHRGVNGGFSLAQRPEDISVAEII